MIRKYSSKIGKFLGMITLLLCGCTNSSDGLAPPEIGTSIEQSESQLVSNLTELVSQNNIVGLSIGLIDKNGLMWSKGFGYANKTKKRFANKNSIYFAGSLTKPITAMAIMQLHERSQLDIDAPLQDYIPEFSIKRRSLDSTPITLRMILTHHSGLPTDMFSGWENPARVNLLSEISREYLSEPPNTVFSYSNLAYGLLEDVIERVTGQGYRTYLQENIFNPLEMYHTSFDRDKTPLHYLAQGYSQTGKQQKPPTIRDVAAGGMLSSVNDLGLFIQAILNQGSSGPHTLLSKSTNQEMMTPQNDGFALDLSKKVGLGWAIDSIAPQLHLPEPIIWHNGSIGSFNSLILTLPKTGIGVVVLANSEHAEKIVYKAGLKVLQHGLLLKTGEVLSEVKPVEMVKPEIVGLSKELRKNLPGTYGGSKTGVFQIITNGKELSTILGDDKLYLSGLEQSQFRLEKRLIGFWPNSRYWTSSSNFSLITIDSRTFLVLNIPGFKQRTIFAEKYRPEPLPQKWKDRLGEYQLAINGENEQISLEDKNGFLKLSLKPKDKNNNLIFWFQPVSNDEAVTIGVGRHCGMTLSGYNNNGVSVLRFSGYYIKMIE